MTDRKWKINTVAMAQSMAKTLRLCAWHCRESRLGRFENSVKSMRSFSGVEIRLNFYMFPLIHCEKWFHCLFRGVLKSVEQCTFLRIVTLCAFQCVARWFRWPSTCSVCSDVHLSISWFDQEFHQHENYILLNNNSLNTVNEPSNWSAWGSCTHGIMRFFGAFVLCFDSVE